MCITCGLAAAFLVACGDLIGDSPFIPVQIYQTIIPYEGSVSEVGLMFDVVLNMSDYIWLTYSNAVSFRIVERDANNNPTNYYSARDYDIQNGKIRFPVYYSEKNGEIVVQLADGTEVAYGLNGGGKINTIGISMWGRTSALGMRTFPRGTNSFYVEVSWEEYSRNINPLSQIVIDDDGEYNFAAWRKGDPSQLGGDAVHEFASAVRIWKQGQLASTAKSANIQAQYHAQVHLTPGLYWIKFAFGSSGWPFGNQFQPPYQDNGGMGGGEGLQ